MSGVVGVYTSDMKNVSRFIYYGLYGLQHRGQVSCGIAVNNNGFIDYFKDNGLVHEVFPEDIMDGLRGNIGIGQVRYAFKGEGVNAKNIEPLVVGYKRGALALAHDGNIVNYNKLRNELEDTGSIFQSDLDAELIANIIAKEHNGDLTEAIKKALSNIKGSYALTLMTTEKLIGIRDPLGIKPLSIGKLENGYVLSSETCAFDTMGAKFLRDVKPGEIVVIDNEGLKSSMIDEKENRKLCLFELIYFARPDSLVDGASIYLSRIEAGRLLAKEHPVDADIVIGAPDSGIVAAIGYAEASKIPYAEGIIKNRYVGRTFIQPTKELRERGVKIKLNILRENIDGKKVILVDDSIIRGTTMKRTVQMLKEAGAKEVHVRVSSPKVISSCHLGMDTPDKENLIAYNKEIKEIEEIINADSVRYISVENMLNAAGEKDQFCKGCFTGEYPIKKEE